MAESVRLEDLCSVLRTKNAGPFLVTLDMMFTDSRAYEVIKENKLITKALIAEMYAMPQDSIVVLEHIDHLHTVKATYKRRVTSGSPGDSDCLAMNQEGPMLRVEFPRSLFEGVL